MHEWMRKITGLNRSSNRSSKSSKTNLSQKPDGSLNTQTYPSDESRGNEASTSSKFYSIQHIRLQNYDPSQDLSKEGASKTPEEESTPSSSKTRRHRRDEAHNKTSERRQKEITKENDGIADNQAESAQLYLGKSQASRENLETSKLLANQLEGKKNEATKVVTLEKLQKDLTVDIGKYEPKLSGFDFNALRSENGQKFPSTSRFIVHTEHDDPATNKKQIAFNDQNEIETILSNETGREAKIESRLKLRPKRRSSAEHVLSRNADVQTSNAEHLKEINAEYLQSNNAEQRSLNADAKVNENREMFEKANANSEIPGKLKHPGKVPKGRRPGNRRSDTLMKHRASSMSALQHESEDPPSGNYNWMNNSVDFSNIPDGNGVKISQHSLYRYSSDEDSINENVMLDAETFNQHINNNADDEDERQFSSLPPSIPQRSQNDVIYTQANSISPVDALDSSPTDIAEYRSLPRFLLKRSEKNSNRVGMPSRILDVHQHSSPTMFGEDPHAKNSSDKLCQVENISSSRASPEMDDLDNLLMTRSIDINMPQKPETNLLTIAQDGSEASTCKASSNDGPVAEVEEKRDSLQLNSQTNFRDSEIFKQFDELSGVVQIIQRQTSGLEKKMDNFDQDTKKSGLLLKKDITMLRESTGILVKDVDKVAKTVSILSNEAKENKQELTIQRQETDHLHRLTVEALSRAEKAKSEYEEAKNDYESLIKELHALVTSIQTSLLISEIDDVGSEVKRKTKESGERKKEQKELNKKEIAKEPSEGKKNERDREVKKSNSNKETSSRASSGYQSFFHRPSSLIYGLTSKSSNKSVSFADNKKDEKHLKKVETDKVKEKEVNEKKKMKRDREKESKHSEAVNVHQEHPRQRSQIKISKSESAIAKKVEKEKRIQNDHHPSLAVKAVSNMSLDEQIPMMDEYPDVCPKSNLNSVGISHVSINMSAQKTNIKPFPLESRPRTLKIPDQNQDSSNLSTPESLIDQEGYTTSLNKPKEQRYSDDFDKEELRYTSDSSLFTSNKANIGIKSLSRHTASMTSVPEEHILPSQNVRQGSYAISRQHSSPNLPIQRQGSTSAFPIQRQNSLGTVPEEGTLPRQLSLLSVPEDRPIVDQTLPLSPSPSMTSFSLSPSSSRVDARSAATDSGRFSFRNSMELVTGPVLSSSFHQENTIATLPSASDFKFLGEGAPISTSSLKKEAEKKRDFDSGVDF